jgi:hypothetical protein
MMSGTSQKCRPFNVDLSRGNRQKSTGCSSIVTLFFVKESLAKTDLCAGIVVKEKRAVGSQFFGEFPSYRIPKATKDVRYNSLMSVRPCSVDDMKK